MGRDAGGGSTPPAAAKLVGCEAALPEALARNPTVREHVGRAIGPDGTPIHGGSSQGGIAAGAAAAGRAPPSNAKRDHRTRATSTSGLAASSGRKAEGRAGCSRRRPVADVLIVPARS